MRCDLTPPQLALHAEEVERNVSNLVTHFLDIEHLRVGIKCKIGPTSDPFLGQYGCGNRSLFNAIRDGDEFGFSLTLVAPAAVQSSVVRLTHFLKCLSWRRARRT